MKKVVLIAVILALAIGASQIWAQGGPGRPGGPGGPGGPGCAKGGCVVMALMPPPAGMAEQFATALALDTDTAAALKDILTAGEATIQPLQKTAADAAKAAKDALAAETFDRAAAAELAGAAQEAEAAVIAASLDVWAQIRGILTAEQIAALKPGPGGPPPAGGGPGMQPPPPPPPGDGPGVQPPTGEGQTSSKPADSRTRTPGRRGR